jgi:hypothetical protein
MGLCLLLDEHASPTKVLSRYCAIHLFFIHFPIVCLVAFKFVVDYDVQVVYLGHLLYTFTHPLLIPLHIVLLMNANDEIIQAFYEQGEIVVDQRKPRYAFSKFIFVLFSVVVC